MLLILALPSARSRSLSWQLNDMMRKFPYSTVQLVLALTGFVVASLLYFAHRHVVELPCSSTGGGCDQVNTSRYSHIGPIPVAVIGMAGYAAIALLAMCKLTASTQPARQLFSWLILIASLGATAFSWYLQYLAAYNIGAFCIWCRASAIIMTLIFVTSASEQLFQPGAVRTATQPAGS